MPGALKDLSAFESDIEARPQQARSIIRQDILDMIVSSGRVAGCMWINNGSSPTHDIVCTESYERVDCWDGSRDTRGVQDGLDEVPPKGRYRLKNAGDGDYLVSGSLRITAMTGGTYKARISVDEDGILNPTGFRDSITLEADESGLLIISGCLLKNQEADWDIQLELRGNNGKQITVNYGQFQVQRV